MPSRFGCVDIVTNVIVNIMNIEMDISPNSLIGTFSHLLLMHATKLQKYGSKYD